MIDVTFSIISGTKHALRLRDTTTVGEAKQTLSLITDSPPHTLTLLHKARILNDNDKLKDLDFSSRKFIAVGIRRKSLTLQKNAGNVENSEDETSPLKAIFGDSFATVRRHFLENPASVPILIAYIARSDPANARLLTESPQILLRFLGISPEEFIVAINNMTQRFQQDQNNGNQGANNNNENPNQQQTQTPQVQETNEQVENSTNSENQVQQEQNENTNNQQDDHQNQPSENSEQKNVLPQAQENLSLNSLDKVDFPPTIPQNHEDDEQHSELPVPDNSTRESSQSTATRNSDIDIASFLATMTNEDLSNLEIVLSTNVSLEEAIPVFLQTGKNVDATINALRRTRTT